jgi:hypothetical protein
MRTFESVTATTIGAALMLSAALATPVFAQAAISEPGAYAFYHPNGDVLNAGAGGVRSAPETNALAMVPYGRVIHHRVHHGSHEFTAKRLDRYSPE